MSNILHRELRSTYRWLRTFIPWVILRKHPGVSRVARRVYRRDMSENRVFASLWARVQSLLGRVARWPL